MVTIARAELSAPAASVRKLQLLLPALAVQSVLLAANVALIALVRSPAVESELKAVKTQKERHNYYVFFRGRKRCCCM